ncbi:YggS family pyridoxal phosphate-dependent enzyme [Desulforamulus aquiferis]|uniref:Pyridoxal phosphate homeostasis protein n=1 Tax=Desulforamulus aquiferis TaxID=1397668 RepID=A0AAW7ZFL4_9FIRM|nr:YggS family pyridoxal phosphate-dependent enzyme [Desulforamulus aquiferis]MDO7787964.1 YggS family pyridoxal phosphate-dependent enzyme [Desulforamulus aquiferis]
MGIAENVIEIQREMDQTSLKCKRNPEMVTLIGVTKNITADKASQAVRAGILDLGENRVQELQNKHPLIQGVRWHFIGHLQSNKVKYIIDKVHLIHSLDRWSLALEIDRRAREINRVVPVLIQVNVANEATKFGLEVQETYDFVTEVSGLKGISVQGLMTIAPFVEDPEEVRPVFKQLKDLSGHLKNIPGVQMEQLSMGMTNDYRVAIEEGSTMVRIGTAIFGYRDY